MISSTPSAKRGQTLPAGGSSTKTFFHTIGYEQNDPNGFLDFLETYGIGMVVDVRQMPLSRKKGFSKNQLRALLKEKGIDYLHMPTLGAPKLIRDRLRENGSWVEYVKGYKKIIVKRADEIKALIEMAQAGCICLLCFERKPEECHRSLIAEEMEKQGSDFNVKAAHIRY